jgi:hypothetical protein
MDSIISVARGWWRAPAMVDARATIVQKEGSMGSQTRVTSQSVAGQTITMQTVVSEQDNQLMLNIMVANTAGVCKALENGARADLTTSGDKSGKVTPVLMYAVSCRGDQFKVEHKLPIVKLLLEHGADPNRKDARGTTALITAVRSTRTSRKSLTC